MKQNLLFAKVPLQDPIEPTKEQQFRVISTLQSKSENMPFTVEIGSSVSYANLSVAAPLS